MKKVLLLGGTYGQIYSIQTAKRLGYYTITCDYNPNNPGHKFADEYYEISTLDKEAVLKLSKKLKIDGIVCYGVDTPAITAAYVAEKMGLPGQPLKSVEILTNKDLFRKFLQDNGFKCPKAKGYTSLNINDAIKDFNHFKKPVIIKPVDSSGSKGVSKVVNKEDLKEKIIYSLYFSRNNRFIMEEYVYGEQMSGDLFSNKSKLIFSSLGKHYFYNFALRANCFYNEFNNKNNFIKNKIDNEVNKLLNLLNMDTGVYNLEVRINSDDITLMELSPRNGGNLTPIVIKYATGIDLAEITIKNSVNDPIIDLNMNPVNGYWAYYILHPKETGIFSSLKISNKLKNNNIVELQKFIPIGTKIYKDDNSDSTIAIMILKFSSMDEMLYKINNMDKYIIVRTEQNRTELIYNLYNNLLFYKSQAVA